ncbi:hypothetical protein TALC_01064 [Thermoplasmatales archaeon BRNA1]|nr:hypothetical protein TALC_01064 [Thermoplasmatales archaeon BRNA1]
MWFKTTADNLARDPRAEFLVWQGKYAFSVQVVLSRTSDDAAEVELINEALDKMDMKADSVWIFTPQSVTDEGITPTTGQKIV